MDFPRFLRTTPDDQRYQQLLELTLRLNKPLPIHQTDVTVHDHKDLSHHKGKRFIAAIGEYGTQLYWPHLDIRANPWKSLALYVRSTYECLLATQYFVFTPGSPPIELDPQRVDHWVLG